LKRNLGFVHGFLESGRTLPPRLETRLGTIETLYEQQKSMYDSRTHRVADRIVSLSQPWLRPIVRGKAKAPVEFGVKLDVSVSDGYTRLESASFNAYNEGTLLQDEIERFRSREGRYPKRVLADKIYRTRENLRYCKSNGIHLSGLPLGRPPKNADHLRKQARIEECERIEVERRFSLAKRKYGLGTLYTRLQETSLCAVALSILLLNLNKVLFCGKNILMELLDYLFMPFRNLSVVQ